MGYFKLCKHIARGAHRHQINKGGGDFFDHLVNIAGLLKGDIPKSIVVLQYTVTQNRLSMEQLKAAGVPDIVLFGVDILTNKPPGRSYDDHMTEIIKYPFLIKIKMAELFYNTNYLRKKQNDKLCKHLFSLI